jgi:hypothetical protein
MLRVLAPALALAPNLAVLIHFMGEAGLRLGPGRRTRFDIEGYQKTFEGPLNQWAARLFPKPAQVDRLLIEFVTPFAHEEKVQGSSLFRVGE